MGCLRGYRFYLRTVSLFFLFLILFSPIHANAEASSYLDDLLKKAKEKQLHNDRYWEILLHYKPSKNGLESLIDDPRFFLSTEGKRNPELELEATIRAFFEKEREGDDHPRCRFIARYAWLLGELHIDESALPEVDCVGWKKLEEFLHPRSAALVFPAFFMNNPASMFGHTLIRIDGSYQSKLLSYATNYAASTDASDILYPFKGVFGFYKGYFSLFPYYEMIKKYNDAEQRDMWEYPLNLSEEEVRKMIMHLWELKEIYSSYYFFDENCSFNLLFLLEAARPSLHLTDGMKGWVIPVDTIRIVKANGLVTGLVYRPSRATRIRYIASLLDRHSQSVSLHIADRNSEAPAVDTFEPQERREILDLAIETIQYRYSKEEISKEDYLKLFLGTLKARSQLGTLDGDPYPIPEPIPPHEGHLSSRFSLGTGIQKDRVFQEIRYRPAYHDLSDPDEGYLEGSQIVFANTVLRRQEDGSVRLENFDLIDLASLSPRDSFFKPFSFKIKTGLTQKGSSEEGDHLICRLNAGIGFAFRNERLGIYYGLVEADVHAGNGYGKGYTLAGGLQAGVINTMTRFWKVNLSAEILNYEIGDRFQEKNVSLIQTFRINRNNSLSVSTRWEKVSESEHSEAILDWNHYF